MLKRKKTSLIIIKKKIDLIIKSKKNQIKYEKVTIKLIKKIDTNKFIIKK